MCRSRCSPSTMCPRPLPLPVLMHPRTWTSPHLWTQHLRWWRQRRRRPHLQWRPGRTLQPRQKRRRHQLLGPLRGSRPPPGAAARAPPSARRRRACCGSPAWPRAPTSRTRIPTRTSWTTWQVRRAQHAGKFAGSGVVPFLSSVAGLAFLDDRRYARLSPLLKSRIGCRAHAPPAVVVAAFQGRRMPCWAPAECLTCVHVCWYVQMRWRRSTARSAASRPRAHRMCHRPTTRLVRCDWTIHAFRPNRSQYGGLLQSCPLQVDRGKL